MYMKSRCLSCVGVSCEHNTFPFRVSNLTWRASKISDAAFFILPSIHWIVMADKDKYLTYAIPNPELIKQLNLQKHPEGGNCTHLVLVVE